MSAILGLLNAAPSSSEPSIPAEKRKAAKSMRICAGACPPSANEFYISSWDMKGTVRTLNVPTHRTKRFA